MKKVSEPTIGRLSVYLRLLGKLDAEGVGTVSSGELAMRAGTTAAQVRKDLSLFGTFGKRGMGYVVTDLVACLRSILGLERTWHVAVVGAGRIGAALFGYEAFRERGFHIEAVFDTDVMKVGQRWGAVVVAADRDMERVLQERNIQIAVVAVPVPAAQSVVDRIVSAGVRGILNFAPTQLDVPEGVALKSVDMAMEMEGLSYALSRQLGGDGAGRRRDMASDGGTPALEGRD
ncbi:MAG: redox-sensing transcriptional repressor Rex [Gemmatimonadota bacterium]|jgi:redox-sensing transcriptional repressor